MRLLALASFCCALLGCDCNPPPSCNLIPTGELPVIPAAIEGQPATVHVPLGMSTSTDCQHMTVSSVDVTLFDPLNHPVMNTVTFTSSNVANATADVSFTPPVFGPYHLTARFEPSFGTVQLDFTVAANRADAGWHSMPTPASCDSFDVVAGVPLCHSLGMHKLFAFFPDGGTASLDASRFSGDDFGQVWTIDTAASPALHAYALDAGAFVELAATQPDGDPMLAMVARGGSAAVIRAGTLDLWRRDGGTLTSQPIPYLFGSVASWCLTFVPPSYVVAVDMDSQADPMFVNAFTSLSSNIPASPVFAGADDDGVWWSDGVSLNVEGALLNQDAGILHSTPHTGDLTFPAGCPDSQQTPITTLGGFVPRLSHNEIVLELYPIIGPPLGANSRLVWGVDGGTLYWFDRPALP